MNLIHSRLNPKLEVRNTGKHGKGVFAAESIQNGEVIKILSGEKMSLNELVKRVTTDNERIDDPLQIGKRTYIDLDELSRTFNHSCNPNAGLRKVSTLFAIRDINRGEEITYDYSLTVAPTVWSMKCNCGSKKCRRVLGDILTIPQETLERYKELGALQDYMKCILKTSSVDDIGNIRLPNYEINALAELNKKTNNGLQQQ